MRRCNQVVGVLLLILAVWVLMESRHLEYSVEFSPGAGFFPFWLGISLFVLSLILVLSKSIKPKGGEKEDPLPSNQALLRIFLILSALFVSMLLFERIGFLITLFLFIAFLLIFLEQYRWYNATLISLLMVFSVYSIFKIALDIPLPLGILR